MELLVRRVITPPLCCIDDVIRRHTLVLSAVLTMRSRFKYWVVTANNLVAASLVVNYWPNRVPQAAWLSIFTIMIILSNFCGVAFFGKVEYVMSAIKIIVLTGVRPLSLGTPVLYSRFCVSSSSCVSRLISAAEAAVQFTGEIGAILSLTISSPRLTSVSFSESGVSCPMRSLPISVSYFRHFFPLC